MKWKRRAIAFFSTTGTGKKIVGSRRYRMVFSASIAFGCNLLYTLYHGILGAMNVSLWFITMCAFYGIFAIMRFSAILCEHRKSMTASDNMEYFVMKLSGVLLSALSVILSAIVYISRSRNIAIKYDTITMITIATYTFYKITLAVIRAVKQRNNPSPLLTVICNIGYAEVAASVLTLQRSMLVSFGGMDAGERITMTAITGAAGCLFVLILGISMMITGMRKGKSMGKSKIIKANEKIAETVVGTSEKIEDTVVGSYTKIEDAFVDRYLTRDGETVEDAKARLKQI